MQIKTIEIKNFKAIESLEYTPNNKVAVLCAPNGTGKSSFLEAIRFGLTGDSPDNCINDHADETTVSITVNEELSFSRTKHLTKPTKVRVNGKATTAKNLETVIADETGINKDVMRVTTSQDILSAMKPDELGTLLMSYVPEELDFDTLIKYIPGLTPAIQAELSAYLPSMPIKFGLDAVDEAYKRIFEDRSFAKKDKEKREAQVNLSALDAPSRPLADILKEMEEIAKKEGAQAAAKAAQELYDAAVITRKKAEESLEELQKQIDAITATKPNDEAKKDLSTRKASCNDTVSKANSMIAMLENNIEVFKNTLENLNKPVCPISEKLVCTTDKSKVKEELEELVTSNEEGIALQKCDAFAAAVTEAQLSEGSEAILAVNGDDALRVRVAQRIADAFTAAGLPVRLEKVAEKDFQTFLKTGKYDLYLGQTKLSPNMDLSAFFSEGGNLSYGGLADTTLFALNQKALANKGNFYNLHEQIMKNGNLIPILFRSYAIYATRGTVTALTPARDHIFHYSTGRSLADALITE